MKTWRELNKEVTDRASFLEIEKFMIFVEAEEFLNELDDEVVDLIIEIAFDIRENTEYMSCTGVGVAIYSWLFDEFEEKESEDELEMQSLKIKEMDADEIRDKIYNTWYSGDFQ